MAKLDKDAFILDKMSKNKSLVRSLEIKMSDVRVIALDKLVKFKTHPFQMYEGERLEKLADSIKEIGLQNPIVVRPIEEEKYEILSGHNRVEAARFLG